MTSKIKVGIIGVQPGRGWASSAHIPALRALPGFEITAVSTTRQESADAAAQFFNVRHAFEGHEKLVNSPDVDLVVVTVKVPHHFELVSAAIAAGKHVYCEWPLGNGLAEAEKLAALARHRQVLTAVGLQGRVSPDFMFVRELLQSGAIGRVLSSVVTGNGPSWGNSIDKASAYTADIRNGANLLTIPVMHTLDTLTSILSPIVEVRAHLGNRRQSITVAETGEVIEMTSPDEVSMIARTAETGNLTLHFHGGNAPPPGLQCTIHGENGEIRFSGANGFTQMIKPQIAISRAGGPFEEIAATADRFRTEIITGPASNVAELYSRFADDCQKGGQTVPTFEAGLANHHLLEAIECSNANARWVVA